MTEPVDPAEFLRPSTPSKAISFIPDETGGVMVTIAGQPQSYVDLSDPGRLDFEYVAHFAAAIDALMPPGPLRVTHLGGGALSLARWVNHTRPGSPQIVLEPYAELTRRVRAELPLPRDHRIRVREQRAEDGLAALGTGSAQLLVIDAFDGAQVPPTLVTGQFLESAARVVEPGGIILMNLADRPGLGWAARVAAGLGSAMGEVAVIATTDVAKGRRFGNLVFVGSREPIDSDAISQQLRPLPFPAMVLDRQWLFRRSGSHPSPFTSEDAQPSPVPVDVFAKAPPPDQLM